MSDSTERAAVVAWLRWFASVVWEKRKRRPWQIYGRWVARNAFQWAADKIERGDHIKGDSDET